MLQKSGQGSLCTYAGNWKIIWSHWIFVEFNKTYNPDLQVVAIWLLSEAVVNELAVHILIISYLNIILTKIT